MISKELRQDDEEISPHIICKREAIASKAVVTRKDHNEIGENSSN